MTLDLTYVKSYLRVDFSDDDTYLTDLISLSKRYIYEQTGVEYSENDEIYKQAVLLSVSHFYGNRSPISEKTVNVVPFSMEAMVRHIGLRGPLANEQ